MTLRTDLHIHTTASDGRWHPQEVVAHVLEEGIGLFAVIDHESVGSVEAAAALAREAGLAFLNGVEISALFEGSVFHILGYGIDPRHAGLLDLLEANKARMNWINEEVLRRLIAAGYPVSLAEYEAFEYDLSRGGWKALNYLIDKGVCQGAQDFFTRLFVDPFRPPAPDFPPVPEVVDAVRAAGGVPILAHPGGSLRHVGVRGETLAPFRALGVTGLECYSSYHDAQTTAVCLDFCARHDWLVTGGSDCHGGFVGRPLGVPRVDASDLRLGELEGLVRAPVR
ncbi:MAG: PHP domain-containing protein [Anaerolineae bacterium]|nr:PHP domain-containing protein [Anaerolineae bacterium]